MNQYLPWVALLAVLAWLAVWLLKRGRRQRDLVRTRAARQREALAQAAIEQERRAARERADQHARREAAATATATQLEESRRQAARAEAEQRAAEASARLEAERLRAERLEAERRAGLEAARQEAEQLAAEAARQQARLASEQAARAQAQRQAALATSRAATPARTPAQTRVMVADDSKVVRVKISRLLAKHGYNVALAEDGADAARQIADGTPDVLITDVEMPGLDGFELSRRVRGNPRTAHIPIIMVTGAAERHGAEAAEAGVSVLLGKPYGEDELIAHIEAKLNQLADAHTLTPTLSR